DYPGKSCHLDQPWRDSPASANLLDGWPSWPELSSHRFSLGVDAGSGTGLVRFICLPSKSDCGAQARSAALQSLLLRRNRSRAAQDRSRAWRLPELVEGCTRHRARSESLASLVSPDRGPGITKCRCRGGPKLLDARYAPELFRCTGPRFGHLQRSQSDIL